MTGAMYAGIAGLRTHMSNLNVIGNNIANVNTPGYKAGRGLFRTSLYTRLSSGREGTSVVGSKNPSQIGYGSNLSSVDIDMSTASFSPGKPTDCMIDGDGFFMLGDKSQADVVDPKDASTLKSFDLTRVGDFEFKSDGYLSNSAGQVVYGFLCMGAAPDGTPIYSDQLVPIRVPRQDGKDIVWPTYQWVDKEGNSLGTGDTAPADDSRWALRDTLYAQTDEAAGGADDAPQKELVQARLNNITISSNGVISATVDGTGQEIIIGAIAIGKVDNPNGVTQISDSCYRCSQGAGNLYVNMLGGVAKDAIVAKGNLPTDQTIVLPTPPVGGEDADDKDGTSMDGILHYGMSYVNDSVVNGANEAGGDEEIELSDVCRVYDTGSSTELVVGGLETSKTDLAKEIADMITTQRGYQANTRVITVTDSMLEELVNMKR